MASVSQDIELFVPNNTSDFVYISLTEQIKMLEWNFFFLHQLFTPFLSCLKVSGMFVDEGKCPLHVFMLVPVRCQ